MHLESGCLKHAVYQTMKLEVVCLHLKVLEEAPFLEADHCHRQRFNFLKSGKVPQISENLQGAPRLNRNVSTESFVGPPVELLGIVVRRLVNLEMLVMCIFQLEKLPHMRPFRLLFDHLAATTGGGIAFDNLCLNLSWCGTCPHVMYEKNS